MATISKCSCPNCGIHVEFDASGLVPGEVRKGPCPSCGGDMWFFENNPVQTPELKAEKSGSVKRLSFPTLQKMFRKFTSVRNALGEKTRRPAAPKTETPRDTPKPAASAFVPDHTQLFLWWPASLWRSLVMAVFVAYTGLIFFRSLVLLVVFVANGSFPDVVDFLKLLLTGILLTVGYIVVVLFRHINVVAPYKRKLARQYPDIECDQVSFQEFVSANSGVALKTCLALCVVSAVCGFNEVRMLTRSHGQLAEVRDGIARLKDDAQVYQERVSNGLEAAQELNDRLKQEAGNQSLVAEAYNGSASSSDSASPQFLSSDPTEANSAARQAAYMRAQSYTQEKRISELKAAARQANEAANAKINELVKDNADRFLTFRAHQIASVSELALFVGLAFVCVRFWKKAKTIPK